METLELELDLDQITVDPDIQDREEMSEEVVDDYATKLHKLPPVVIFYDGKIYRLAAGHHRYMATEKAGKRTIPAEVREGGKLEAILYAVQSNAGHGKTRSVADKRRACSQLLKYFSEWTDRKIAEESGVSYMLVADVRKELYPAQVPESGTCAGKRTGRDDKAYPSKQELFDRDTKPWIKDLIKRDLDRSSRNIAAEVKCSPRSVDKVRKEMIAAGEIQDDGPPSTTQPKKEGKKKEEPKPEPAVELDPSILRDQIGLPVPPELTVQFTDTLLLFDAATRTTKELAKLLDTIAKTPGGEAMRFALQMNSKDGRDTFKSPELDRLLLGVKLTMPHVATCPTCRGSANGKQCLVCKDRHWITAEQWKHTTAVNKARIEAEIKKGK